MKSLFILLVLTVAVNFGDAFSKYGRSCKDIGCTSNEVCVMKEDPCSLRSKNNDCGMYPSCQRVSNAAASCDTYVCPPTQICKLDNGQPRCYDDPGSTGMKDNKQLVQSYYPGPPSPDAPSAPVLNTNSYPQNPNSPPNSYPGYPNNPSSQNYPVRPNYPQNPNPPYNPNYPSNPNQPPQNYPTNPNAGQQPAGGGYQGGAVGSGYPGASYPRQGGGYPVQSGGYPSQGGGYPGYTNQKSGYPSQGSGYPGYPSQSGGYPSQSGGYPSQSGGYPSQGGGYPSQGGGYPSQQGNYPRQQGGYSNYPSQGKPSGQDSSIPYLDKITNTLKTIGLFWFVLKFVVSRGNCVFS